ncbi:MAG: hypothetical protein P8N02_14420 [Actinomycetota bacterium]|nr:hypothetical protein [Actinomycetota bacterium]
MLMDMGFVKMEIEGNEPMMTGLFDGQRVSMHADLAVMFDEMADSDPLFKDAFGQLGISRDQLTMDAIYDGTTMYLHAPIFGAPGMNAGGAIDLGVLVNGVDTTRLVAPVSLGDLMVTQGNPSSMLEGFGASLEGQLDTMMAAPVDVVVNVDNQGLLRRVFYDIDLGQAFSSLMADEMGSMFGDLEMRMGLALEFNDYGHNQQVQLPATSTDITNTLSGLFSVAA